MTREEFNDALKILWEKFNPDKDKEFLLTVVDFDENDNPSDFHIYGAGCPCCIIDLLTEKVIEGELTHLNREKSVH